MFRTGARVRTSSRPRVTDWIPKMLFLWTREPVAGAVAAGPRAGPWFAWFATAVLLWRCRRRIAKAVLDASSPLRLLRRKRTANTASLVVSKAHHHHHHHHSRRHHQQQQKPSSAPVNSAEHRRACHQHTKYTQHGVSTGHHHQQKPHSSRRDVGSNATSASRPRLKRLHAGDGPHMTSAARKLAVNSSCHQISQQLYCRMTRSGRVYGKYPNKQLTVKL